MVERAKHRLRNIMQFVATITAIRLLRDRTVEIILSSIHDPQPRVVKSFPSWPR